MNKQIPLLIAAALLSAASSAQAVSFTSSAAFLSHVQPSYYLEDFNGLTGNTNLDSPVSFSGNGFSYDASNLAGVYTTPSFAGDVALSILFSGQAITITFTGAPVTAVGGNLYGSDVNGEYVPGAMTMLLDNGESITLPNPTPTSFAGFITSSPIISMSVLPENFNSAYWPTLDNLVVGQAVIGAIPEPSTFSLMVGIAALFGPVCTWHKRNTVRRGNSEMS